MGCPIIAATLTSMTASDKTGAAIAAIAIALKLVMLVSGTT